MSLSKEYQVEITETLQRIVTVTAETVEEAVEEARKLYDDSDVVLCSDDFVDVTIEICK